MKFGPWGHLELTWNEPRQRRFFEALARSHTLIRFDKHGTGLSDSVRSEYTVESEVADIAAVVDHLGLERFVLFGVTGEAAATIAYAADNPGRVSKLILFAPFAYGASVGTKEVRDSAVNLMRSNFRLGTKVFADIIAAGDEECERFFVDTFGRAATPENAARLFELVYDTDVRRSLPRITCPTLVLHREHDRAMPIHVGREVASGIAGSKFVLLEGRNNWPEFGDSEAVLREIDAFLGTESPHPALGPALLRERYEPIEVAGSGGQGEVMRAIDRQHERQVALKIRPASDPSMRQTLLQEARVLLGLRPHPGLPLVRDDFFADERYVIVMDWVEGTDLRTLLDTQGDPGLPVASVLAYLSEVAEALDHLHNHEPPIVHGDVKPANMILTPQGRVVLVDFGIASGSGEVRGGSGTRGYVAPEIAAGQAATPAADIFGLAATAFALLTGQSPDGQWPEWEGFAARTARTLGRAIRLGMSVDPERRPRRATELIDRLRSWQEANLPTGTVTFLMTDVEGSTPLWDTHPEAMPRVLERHERIVAGAVESNSGRFIKSRGEGDSTLSVFVKASDAAKAAIEMQRAIAAQRWPDGIELRIRAGLHTGEAELREGDYYGTTVNRAARIRGVASGGEILISQTTAQLISDGLPPDVLLVDRGSHELKGLSRAEQIFQIEVPGAHTNVPRLAVPPVTEPISPLPEPRSNFVGRSRELKDVLGALTESRIVTLVGPGGCGKTRLALEAAKLRPQATDDIYFVDLVRITDIEAVPAAIAAAIGADRRRPGLESAVAALSDRRALIVLDNCEHVLAGVRPAVEALFAGCTRVRFLATSRERLRVADERVYEVPSLSTFAEGGRSEAAELFLTRYASMHATELGDREGKLASEICARLEGLPLAIELAVARTRVLSLEQLSARLDDRLRVLKGGTGDLRHQTLDATISWSYDLLTETEKHVLRRLSAFVGSWSLEAAESVCGSSPVAPEDVLDAVAELVEKSLLVVDRSDTQFRYRALETIREFARAQLDASGEAEAISRRHFEWVVSLTDGAESGMLGPNDRVWLDKIAADIDNVRLAIEWAAEHDPAAGQLLASELWAFWWMRGAMSEGRRLLELVLSASEDTPPAARAKAHTAAAFLAYHHGDTEEIRRHAEASIAIADSAGGGPECAHEYGWSTSWAMVDLGTIDHASGDISGARRWYEKALKVAEESASSYAEARACQHLAMVANAEGDAELCLSYAEKGLELTRRVGNKAGINRLLTTVGSYYLQAGRTAEARSALEEALTGSVEVGDSVGIQNTSLRLGALEYATGDPSAGRELLQRSIDLLDSLGRSPERAAGVLIYAATTALEFGDAAAAEGWLDEAEDIANRHGLAEALEEIRKTRRSAPLSQSGSELVEG